MIKNSKDIITDLNECTKKLHSENILLERNYIKNHQMLMRLKNVYAHRLKIMIKKLHKLHEDHEKKEKKEEKKEKINKKINEKEKKIKEEKLVTNKEEEKINTTKDIKDNECEECEEYSLASVIYMHHDDDEYTFMGGFNLDDDDEE